MIQPSARGRNLVPRVLSVPREERDDLENEVGVDAAILVMSRGTRSACQIFCVESCTRTNFRIHTTFLCHIKTGAPVF